MGCYDDIIKMTICQYAGRAKLQPNQKRESCPNYTTSNTKNYI